MKKIFYKTLLTLGLILVGSQISLAADNAAATRTIADVLLNFNHFPSDAEKAELMALAEDDGVGRAFRIVASAISNIQHTVTADDKDIMNRIIASDRAHDNAKLFAEILLGFSHAPSDDVKALLQEML